MKLRLRFLVLIVVLFLASAMAFTQVPSAPAGKISVWDSNFGELTLVQEGPLISGTYNYAGGRIIAAIGNGVIYGYWWENDDSTGCGPDKAWCGPFVFVLAPDGKSFRGYYDKAARGITTISGLTDSYTWTGTLKSGGIARQ